MSERKSFDYVIIGGGQAGLVVASRLSEDETKTVLVLEAGADTMGDERVQTPGLMTTLYGNKKYDWCFMSAPQSHVNDRVIACPRGKGLGGSSSINFSAIMYPAKTDFDAWEALGNASWDFDSLAPYFRKFETFYPPTESLAQDVTLGDVRHQSHGTEGPVKVGFNAEYGNFNQAWKETFEVLGMSVGSEGDAIEGRKLGAFVSPLTIDPATSKRVSSATAYYGAGVSQRKNLNVWTECVVEKVLLETVGNEVVATGVEFTKNGEHLSISANFEIILCAGAIKSPQILELSGIGSRELLEKHNIPVIVENTNVGENLQDHPLTSISFEVSNEQVSGDILRDPNIVQAVMENYRTAGTGPMTGSPLSFAYSPLVDANGTVSPEEVKQIVKKHVDDVAYPHFPAQDRQYQLLSQSLLNPMSASAEYLYLPLQVNGAHTTSMAKFFGKDAPENYITIVAMLNRPFSRGVVHIASADPAQDPLYDPRYLSHPLDIEILARHMQYISTIAATAPFSSLLKPQGKTIPDLKSVKLNDLEAAKEVVKERLFTAFHPSGTCAMMPREMGGVVDAELKVYGTKNLRVCDASVFPLEPLGNIMASVYAVAEKGADLIKSGQK